MTAISPSNLDRAPREPALWRPLELVLRPLDEVRRWSWGLSAKTAFGRACLRDRGLRLTTLALGHIAVAAVLTVVAPVWLLLLGPIVLGVPHVASDIRYLLINPPLPLGRRGLVLLLGPLAAMTGLRVASALGAPYWAEAEVVLGAAAMLGGVAIAQVGLRRKLVVSAVPRNSKERSISSPVRAPAPRRRAAAVSCVMPALADDSKLRPPFK